MRHLSIWATVSAAMLLATTTTTVADGAIRKCAGKRVTIVGTSGPDTIRGTRRADVIDGLGGNDLINGLGGNDTICGNHGSDDLRGNGGADRLYGGPDGWGGFGDAMLIGDRLRGGSGNDTLVPGVDIWIEEADETQSDSILYDTSPRAVVVDLPRGIATGDGTDRLVVNGPVTVVTTRFADRVDGSRFDDHISVGVGADTVSAGAGNDWVTLDRGHPFYDTDTDSAIGGPGNDSLFSDGGQDRLAGGLGNDLLSRLADGNGSLEGGQDNDYLNVHTSPESLAANVPAQDERVSGGSGVDLLRFLAPTGETSPADLDIARGVFELGTSVPMTLSFTSLEGYAFHGGVWEVAGSSASDFVDARFTSFVNMTGLAGDDTLRGSLGDDTFNGGAGTQDCFQHNGAPDGTDTLTAVETETDIFAPCPWPAGHPGF